MISLQYSFVCRNLIRETIPSITVVHTDDVIDDRAGLFVVGSVYEKDKLNYSYLFSKLSFKTPVGLMLILFQRMCLKKSLSGVIIQVHNFF